jgi:hypothetical protein
MVGIHCSRDPVRQCVYSLRIPLKKIAILWQQIDKLAPSPENAVVAPSRPDHAKRVFPYRFERFLLIYLQLTLNGNAGNI